MQSKTYAERTLIDLVIDRPVLWQGVAVDDAPQIEEYDKHYYFFTLNALLSSTSATSKTSAGCFGACFQALTPKSITYHQW